MPYVFFDVETTGLNIRFDQIVQFAAIYTDEQFNERDRINISCRLLPHIIPSMEAMVINQKSLQQMMDNSLCSHYEMILEIHSKLNSWAPATFVGWNTIKFDEEFLRSAFYQCLLPRFVTNTNGSNRFDLLRLVKSIKLLEPDSINIPLSDDGQTTYALSKVASENGFIDHDAHDALSDVLATIHIAKLLKSNARFVWSLGNRFSNKQVAMETITPDNPAVAIESIGNNIFCYPFIKIGDDPNIAGNYIVADLRSDFSGFSGLSESDKRCWLLQSPRPIHRIKCNTSPIIMPFDEIDQFPDYDLEVLSNIAVNLESDKNLCDELTASYLAATHKEFPNKFVEEQIYGRFPDAITKEIRAQFHRVPWQDRPKLLNQMPDRRFAKLGLRLVAEHAPQYLSANQHDALEKFETFRKLGFSDKEVPWRTLRTARRELSELKLKNAGSFERLREYERYLDKLAETIVTQ